MLWKLDEYKSRISTFLMALGRVLYPCFPNDFISDAEVLRQFVTLPMFEGISVEDDDDGQNKTLLEKLLDECSLEGPMDDEITIFLRATSHGDSSLEPLKWWRGNEARFPYIASVARDVFAVQATLVASESQLSCAGTMIGNHKTSLSDEIVSACFCAQS